MPAGARLGCVAGGHRRLLTSWEGTAWDAAAGVVDSAGAVQTWTSGGGEVRTLAYGASVPATYVTSVPRAVSQQNSFFGYSVLLPTVTGVGLTNRLHLFVVTMNHATRTVLFTQSADPNDLQVLWDFFGNGTVGPRYAVNGVSAAGGLPTVPFPLGSPTLVGWQYEAQTGRMLWISPAGIAVQRLTGLPVRSTNASAYQVFTALDRPTPFRTHAVDVSSAPLTDDAVAARVQALRTHWNAV